MHIKTLKLQNFRNYEDARFVLDPAVNLICGENGQGKTNLLEAAAACSTMRLFRTAQKKEGLRFGENHAFIFADFLAQERDISLELRFSRTKAMEIYKNGVRQKRQSDAQGLLKTVLFCPEDLMLVRAGAAARRRFLDTALCQMRPNYARYLEEYNRLHEHKTRILRDSEEYPSLLDTLPEFDMRMAQSGAVIIYYRARFCERLKEYAGIAHRECSGGREELGVEYQTVSTISDPLAPIETIYDQLRAHQASHAAAERASRMCLSGPHKDDIAVTIGGVNARQFSSQGQTRTAALAFKLAEREIYREITSRTPLLLLDDVLSELDPRRQEYVLNRILGGQVFITCCEEDRLGTLLSGKVFHISQGAVV